MADRPPAAVRARAQRLTEVGAFGWSPDIGPVAALRSVGFEFAGEVLGCVAATLTRDYVGFCGYRPGQQPPIRLGGSMTSSYARAAATYGSRAARYPMRVDAAHRTALDRMRNEVTARGGDGAVGLSLDVQVLDGDLHEIVVSGFAVRARGAIRPPRPFLTTLAPERVAELLAAGWVPVDLHVATEVGVRHDAVSTNEAAQIPSYRDRQRSNFEYRWTGEVLARVRSSVRDKLRTAIRMAGADGALKCSLDATSWRHDCGMGAGLRGDLVVAATGWASSVARFRPSNVQTRELTILPLSKTRSSRANSSRTMGPL